MYNAVAKKAALKREKSCGSRRTKHIRHLAPFQSLHHGLDWMAAMHRCQGETSQYLLPTESLPQPRIALITATMLAHGFGCATAKARLHNLRHRLLLQCRLNQLRNASR